MELMNYCLGIINSKELMIMLMLLDFVVLIDFMELMNISL